MKKRKDIRSGRTRKTLFRRPIIIRSGLGKTLFLWFITISLIPPAAISIISYQNAYNSLKEDAIKSLSAVAGLKRTYINDFFSDKLTDLSLQSQLKSNVEFLEFLKAGFESSGMSIKEFVKSQKWARMTMNRGIDLRNFRGNYGYYDVFLIDSEGNVLFSVMEEDDLGTNAFTGKHADTLFGRACRKALETGKPVYSDLEFYAPSNNNLASFLVQVVIGEEGDKVGLLALQVPTDRINDILQDSTGLGKTGETYLVGPDMLMRSDSRFFDDSTILKERVDTDATRTWRKEEDNPHLKLEPSQAGGYSESMGTRVSLYPDYRGIKVLGIYGNIESIEKLGVHWVLISEISEAEAFASVTMLWTIMVIALSATIVSVIVIAVIITRRIIGPVKSLSQWADRIALGDLTVKEIMAPKNEIGELKTSFERVVDSFRDVSGICEAIADGDFSKSVEVRSEFDIMGNNVNRMGMILKEAYDDSQRKISYLNNIPTPVHVIDKDFSVRFINKKGADLVGMEAGECVGKRCYELFSTGHCNTGKCGSAMAMKSDEVLIRDTTAHLHSVETPVRYTSAALKDDHGNVIGAIESIVDISDEIKVVNLAEMISKGDYSVEIRERSEEDRLSAVLNKMTKTLREVTAANEKQDRLKTGQMELNDRIRGEQDTPSLARNIATYIAKYMGAQIAAMYVVNGDNTLRLAGSYAFTMRKNLSHEFRFGEGLVGQAALEKEQIILPRVPDDYITITSGLGETVPRNILVKPIMCEGDVKGVIELGSFDEFTQDRLDFLDVIAGSLGITLNSAEVRARMKGLLQQTQQQAEELKMQQEDLRQSNEELEEQARALKESEERLQVQQEELQQTNEELEEKSGELEEQTATLEIQKQDIQRKNVELEEAKGLIEEKARELETSSKYKSEFLANMSHELRTPLNSILILSKILSDNKNNSLSEKQVEFANTINSSGSELLALIDEILDLSKIEAGKIDLHLEDVNLRNLADNMDRSFRQVAVEKDLSFDIDLADGLPSHIRSDQQRIEQVIKNLLSNAFKFTSRGSVILNIHRPDNGADLSKSGLDPGDAIAFSVSDTGAGIPREKQRLIFDAFQQADGTTSRRHGGTGLGLSISREFAGLLRGEIQLESREAKGSTFTLYIPERFDEMAEETDSSTLVTGNSEFGIGTKRPEGTN